MANFTCIDCGETKPILTNGGTGYGTYGDSSAPVCYACCGKRDRAAMIDSGKATLYLVWRDLVGYIVTNWPDTLSFKPIKTNVGRHNIAGKRYDVNFVGPDGYVWHGVTYGDNTQICHCKRTKQRAA